MIGGIKPDFNKIDSKNAKITGRKFFLKLLLSKILTGCLK
jgi:hypothetical protein